MPAANGSPLIAVSYENVAKTNFDFWIRFAWNARRHGYSCFIFCEESLRAEHQDHLDRFRYENNAIVQIFVTQQSSSRRQRQVMAEFGDIPDIWIDVEPGHFLPMSALPPTLEKVAKKGFIESKSSE